MTDQERIELTRAIAESDIAGCQLENADIDELVDLFDSWLERRTTAAGLAGKQEWLPIESAPKDGTSILLVWNWDSGIHKGTTVVEAQWVCRKHSHMSRSRDCPNELTCDMGWDHYEGTMTHWQPKPEPPPKEPTK